MRTVFAVRTTPVLATLISFASVGAVAQTVTRGPYLQQAAPTSLTIRWRTDVATDAVVRYGPAPGNLNHSAVANESGNDHAVTLAALTPATRYYYSVGNAARTLAGADSAHTFRTPPAVGTRASTRIWVIGDSGTADANARRVRDAYSAYTGARGTDLWLMLGDNAYADGTDLEYQRAVFDVYPALLRTTPLWPTLGNHDGHTGNSSTQQGPYYDIFTLPRNAEAGGLASGTEAYYSFDYGNIHFVSLDSYETDRATTAPMLRWLENDLAATRQEWLIAFWHHPPYSKGSHDSDTEKELVEMRRNALPILESYGVDLVLTGHSHSYERSFLIDGHHGTSTTLVSSMILDDGNGREGETGAYTKQAASSPNQGAVYAVAGSSGKTESGPLDHPVMFVSLLTLGSMVLDVDGNRLDAAFIDAGGTRRDHFTIRKGAASSDTQAPTAVSALAASDITSTSVRLTWQAATDNVGVTEYRVARDGIVVTASNALAVVDSNLVAGTQYSYTVVARDASGNESPATTVTVATQPVIVAAQSARGGRGAADMLSLLVLGIGLLWRCGWLRSNPLRLALSTVMAATPLLATAHEDVGEQLRTVESRLADDHQHDYWLIAKRGNLQGLHGHWRQAVIDLRTAQALAPTEAAAALDLDIAAAQLHAGKPRQALTHVDRYLGKHRCSHSAWLVRARIHAELGDTDAALDDYTRSIRCAPAPTPDLFLERARLIERDPARVEDLLAGVDAGISTLGPIVSLVEYATEIEMRRGDDVAALRRMAALPEQLRHQPRWLLQQSLALERLGRDSEAQRLRRRAMQAIAELPAARHNTPAYAALRAQLLAPSPARSTR